MTQPSCFGIHWSATDVECRGGPDPSYTNPRDGSNRRDKCTYFAQCCARTSANKVSANQPPPAYFTNPHHQVIPTQTLMRPTVAQPTITRPPASPAPMHMPAPVYPQHYPQSVPYTPQQMAPPYQAYYGPPVVPVNHPQLGAQIPGYLTHPEPVDSEVHWIKRLFHEIIRSVFKSSGHTMANFFDHNPITRPRGTPGQ